MVFQKGNKLGVFNTGKPSWNKGLKKEQLKKHYKNGWKSPYIKGKVSRENNPNWKGGKENLNHKIRNCDIYKQWRSNVFQRDNWTCQTCGKPSRGDLEAHHIKKFSVIRDENNIKSIENAIECKELWDINNGITLCKECHNLTRKKKWNG